MKRIIIITMVALSSLLSSCNDFLELEPTVGLTEDKLADIQSMQALIFGAYDRSRTFVQYQNTMASIIVRDAQVRNNPNWPPFYAHTLPNTFTSNFFESGYQVLNNLNIVSTANVQELTGKEADKNRILGDMHFLRALVYFDLNNYFELNSTGNSVPLVLEPIGVNDRLSVASSSAIRAQVELDIEMARNFLAVTPGVADKNIATALAARIYFSHKKYDLAFERANDVITTGGYVLETDVTAPFKNPAGSSEVIFSLKYNSAENRNPSDINFSAFRPDRTLGFASLNPASLPAQLRDDDPTDKRHSQLYTEGELLTYADGKFPTDEMDYIYLRLAELYLIRAEANIMRNNSVSAQDIADVNAIKLRAGAADVINGTPNVTDMLDMIFEERSKELCFEHGDRYLNTRRLEKGIINEDGTGFAPFSSYADLLAYPFPENEIRIHGLTR